LLPIPSNHSPVGVGIAWVSCRLELQRYLGLCIPPEVSTRRASAARRSPVQRTEALHPCHLLTLFPPLPFNSSCPASVSTAFYNPLSFFAQQIRGRLRTPLMEPRGAPVVPPPGAPLARACTSPSPSARCHLADQSALPQSMVFERYF